MGQFDSFTQSVGDSFVGLIGSVGRNIVCPVGCAVCAVMCILSIIGAISSYNLETAGLLNSGANVLQPPSVCSVQFPWERYGFCSRIISNKSLSTLVHPAVRRGRAAGHLEGKCYECDSKYF